MAPFGVALPLKLGLIIGACLLVAVAVWTRQRYPDTLEGTLLSFLGVVSGLWLGLTAAMVHFTIPSAQLLAYLLIPFAKFMSAVLWYRFAVAFTTRPLLQRQQDERVLLGVTVCGIALLGYDLFFSGHLTPPPLMSDPITLIQPLSGPPVVAVLAIEAGLFLLGTLVLLGPLVSKPNRQYRPVLPIAAALTLLAGVGLSFALASPPLDGFDWAVLVPLLMVPAATAGTYLSGRKPVPSEESERIVTETVDPVIVADTERRITQLNDASKDLALSMATQADSPTSLQELLAAGQSSPVAGQASMPSILGRQESPAIASTESSVRIEAAFRKYNGEITLEKVFPQLVELLEDSEGLVIDTAVHVTLPTAPYDRHFKTKVSPLTAQGQRVGFVLYLKEISEQIHAQEELERQNEQAERYATTVSHNLRNPLMVAMGRTNVLLDRLEDGAGLSEEEASFFADQLETVHRSHNQMDAIINDLLKLVRQGNSVSDVEAVSMETAVKEALENIQEPKPSVTVEQNVSVFADKQKLTMLLTEILENARTHAGTDSHVRVIGHQDGFDIIDDGPGFEEGTDQLLEYGYTTIDEGTGLGLSIANTLAEAHDWTLEPVDRDTAGALFRVTGVSVVDETRAPK